MSFLFSAPKVKVPKAEAPAPVPTIDDAQRDRNETERLRRRRGMRGNINTGPLGAVIPASATPPKQLTGS